MTCTLFYTPSGFRNTLYICIWYGFSIWDPQLASYEPKRLLHDTADKLKGWCQNRGPSGLWKAKSCAGTKTVQDVGEAVSPFNS